MEDNLIGTQIHGRYQLIDILGRGGMGVVYKAEDLRLNGRPCAVKLLLGQVIDPNEIKRFESELKIISRLRSPHVVQVIDTGHLESGQLFIVMELLEGSALLDICKEQGALSLSRALSITRGILAGLSEAHELGVIHRDLKPANIFITQTRVGDEVAKVLDFGIAKDTSSDATEPLTGESVVIGTIKYMAPEQLLKEKTDPRTDIYAVGLLLYEMTAGRPPFESNSDLIPDNLTTMPSELQVAWLHLNADAKPLQVQPALWSLIIRMIAKDPADRPSSVIQIADELSQLQHHALLRHELPQTQPVGKIESPLVVALPPVPSPAHQNTPDDDADHTANTLETTPSQPSKSLIKPLLILVVMTLCAVIGWWVMSAPTAPPAPPAGPTPNVLKLSLSPSKLTYSMKEIIQLNLEITDQLGNVITEAQLKGYELSFHSNKASVKIDGRSAMLKGTGRATLKACLSKRQAADSRAKTKPSASLEQDDFNFELCGEADVMVIDDEALPF